MVERRGKAVILVVNLSQGRVRLYLMEDTREVESLRFPVLNAGAGIQEDDAADKVVELANTQLSHDLAHFFGNEEEIVHYMFRLAREFLAKLGVLCCHTHGTGVEVRSEERRVGMEC